ncbi:unnamed protein product [Calypogeia fissa]
MTSRISFLAGALLTFLFVLGTAMATPGSTKMPSPASPTLEAVSDKQRKEIILLNEPGLSDGILHIFDDKKSYNHPPNDPEMIIPAKLGNPNIKIHSIGHLDIFIYTTKDKYLGIHEDSVYSALHEVIQDIEKVGKEGIISWGGYKHFFDSGLVIGIALHNTYGRLTDVQIAEASIAQKRNRPDFDSDASDSSHDTTKAGAKDPKRRKY